MKKSGRSSNWKRYFLLTALLAAVCVGIVELFVCAYQAPEVYAAITAPLRAAAHQAGEAGDLAWNGLSRRFNAAVDDGVAQLKAGLRQLDDYLSELLTPPPQEESYAELQEEIQLVDEEKVAPPPRAQADYSITTLVMREGIEYLTGGRLDLVYYNQTGRRWAEEPYGSDTIGRYGCGPTAMAMVVSTLTGQTIDPVQMAQHCVDQGYWAKKHGSYWSIVPGTAEDFGLICTSLPPEELDGSTAAQLLSTGQLLVALVGPGHFTNGGHFILLRGVTLDGKILVADPASSDRSLTIWDLDLILEELSPNRSSGGPLWAVSSDPFAQYPDAPSAP